MKKILFATNNNHKLLEARQICQGFDVEILSLKDLDIDIEIEETGSTFKENSFIKANAIKEYLNNNKINSIINPADLVIFADDSGLEIDYLNGEPGIYSSRFLSPDATHIQRMNYILDKMKNVDYKDRTARFVCGVTILYKNNNYYIEEYLNGHIATSIRGSKGFGYDPIFIIDEYNESAAVLGNDYKNKISHRAKALKKAVLKIA